MQVGAPTHGHPSPSCVSPERAGLWGSVTCVLQPEWGFHHLLLSHPWTPSDQCCQHKVVRKNQRNGHSQSSPSQIAPWVLQGLIPSLFPVSLSSTTVTSIGDRTQKSFAFFAEEIVCNAEIIFHTFLSFLADVSETHTFLRHRDAR